MSLSVFGCEKNHHSLRWPGYLDRKQRMKVSLVITRLTAVYDDGLHVHDRHDVERTYEKDARITSASEKDRDVRVQS